MPLLLVEIGSGASTSDRLLALERRQAVLIQRLAGDGVTNGAFDPGGSMAAEWQAMVAWARSSQPTAPRT